jgi:hypothetical protein
MMANAFKTTVASLEKELEALITDNQIQVCLEICIAISIVQLKGVFGIAAKTSVAQNLNFFLLKIIFFNVFELF